MFKERTGCHIVLLGTTCGTPSSHSAFQDPQIPTLEQWFELREFATSKYRLGDLLRSLQYAGILHIPMNSKTLRVSTANTEIVIG